MRVAHGTPSILKSGKSRKYKWERRGKENSQGGII
jgi:hypothetical protein